MLRPFTPVSWFHPVGIKRVLARLEPRLPDVSRKLFLTFTVNPALFESPEAAFDKSRDRLRRLFFALRRGVEWEGKRHQIDAPYCIKVEFHENGWAHFHAVFLTSRFLPGALLNHLWDYGRTNVKRINAADFRYLLKYVTKGCDLPDWVMQRARLRVFQSSRGFLKPIESKDDEEPTKPARRVKRKQVGSLGERLERWRKTALLQRGEHRIEQVILRLPFWDILAELVLPIAKAGRYLGGGHVIIDTRKELFPWLQPN